MHSPDLTKEEQMTKAAKHLFERFDLDGSTGLDVEELNDGLDSIGYKLTQRQLRAFKKSVSPTGMAA